MTAALTAAPRVIIDLSEVDYLSGAGVRVFQELGTRAILCGLHHATRIALELSRAIDRLVVVKDRKEALESLITDH